MSLKIWHSTLGTAVAAAFAVIFFAEGWDWLPTLLALWLAAFFGTNLVFASLNRARLSDAALWNLSEYRDHQDFSLAAAREVWDGERPDSRLELRVKLAGRVVEPDTKPAPLSGKDSAAWRLTAYGFRRTRLGAEGDLTPLADQTWMSRLTIEDAGERAFVDPPARLNAGCYREELLTWSGLDRFPAVRTLVTEALTLQGLKKEQFTGVRVAETRLESEPVTVYGTLTREDGFLLSGNDLADDPGSLLVVADRARDKLRLKRRRLPAYWVNAALLALSLPLAGLAVAGSPLFPKHEGFVMLTPGGRQLQIDLGAGTPHIWTFESADARTLVALQIDGKDHVAAAADPLVLTAYAGDTVEYGPGRPGRLKWEDGHWLLDPAYRPQNRSGLLRFRNLTAKKVTLRFPSDPEASGYSWNLKPREGENTDHGNYLTLKNRDLQVAEGTEVSLVAVKAERHLMAGSSPELLWDASLGAWTLQLSDAVLKVGAAPLWAVPHPTRHLRGFVADAVGQSDTFDIPPDPAQKPVIVKSVAGDPYTLTDAQAFTLRQADAAVLYSGPLKDYKGAKWNRDHWEVTVAAP